MHHDSKEVFVPLVGVTVVALSSSAVYAQGIGAASYRAFVVTPKGQSDTGFLPVPTNTSLSYNGIDDFGNPYSYTGEAYATGGRVPLADIQASGSGLLSILSGPLCEAKVTYGYRVMPITGSTRPTVPLVITLAGDARVTSRGAFATANASAARAHPPSWLQAAWLLNSQRS